MSKKQETTADIITEIRDLSKSAKHCELLPTVYGKPLNLYLAELGDRLKAALKREKAAIEADALAVGGLVEASRATTEKSSAVGDAAKLREALVQCELFLGYVSRHGHPTLNPGDKCTACSDADELRGMVVRALAAPPREGGER